MPRGCIAFGGAADEDGAARTLLSAFLEQSVDACVRAWIGESPTSIPLDSEGLRLDAWWRGLTSPEPQVMVSPAQAEHLEHALRSWLRPLTWAASVSPIRTCLRLEEPRPPESWPAGSPWAPAAQDRCWGLSFLLHPLDDPSLLVPAEELWGGNGGPGAALLRTCVERPEEKLLTDLARIAPLWKPLEVGLHRKAPTRMMLDAGEAFSFLSEVSPLLEESGVGVLVPAWWKSPGQRLGVRVRVRRGRSDSARGGHFGVGALSVFDWRLAIGDEPLTATEMAALSEAKGGLVYLRGTWITVDPARLAATARRWKGKGELASFLDVLRWSHGEE
ncbi:MAG: SNF2 helicase-associated domain-containing protein, partial [Thermoplasmata archaeon]